MKIALAAMFACVLAACGEDEQTVPMPQDVSEAQLDSCLNGKGWTHVSSKEIKSNGTLDDTEYWSTADAGKPQEYFFEGDTMTTYMSTEAYTLNVHKKSRYTYNRETHSLRDANGEVFKIIDVSGSELKVVQYKGFSGNGDGIYIYSIYRPMNAGEITLCRKTHPYDMATVNEECPLLPQQAEITPAEFKAKVTNRGWRCMAAYRMETPERYAAVSILTTKNSEDDNLFITADSIVTFKADMLKGVTESRRQKYSYRANSYSLDTGTGLAMRIIALSADEMKVLVMDGTENKYGTYRVYRINQSHNERNDPHHLPHVGESQ